MKVQVVKGLMQNNKLQPIGSILDFEESVAKSLIKDGFCKAVKEEEKASKGKK